MKKYITILNYKTVISLVIAAVTLFITYKFELFYDIDLTLLSIAIIFPLVFNIRGSFRRREKALEYLSAFRSSIITIHYFFMNCSKLTEVDKQEISDVLTDISNELISYLGNNGYNITKLDESIHKVFQFIIDKGELIPRGTKEKIFRFLNDLHDSVENVNAIHINRTPVSLKAYCEIFIYVFPLIYAPTIVYRMGSGSSVWITSFVVLFSEFILISLYNIQDQLEYPFDEVGLDDIDLAVFKFDR